MRYVVWGLCCLVCLAAPVAAQRTVSTDKPIAVCLEVGQPSSLAFHEPIEKVQTMRFGEHGTSGEVTAAQRPLSVEWYGPYCYLTLNLETYAGRMFVLGKSGKQYVVTFKACPRADIVVHVVPSKPIQPTVAPTPVGVPSILRALWTQQPLPGQQDSDVSLPAMPDTRLALVASHAVQVAGYLGVVLHVRNTSEGPLALDLRTDGSTAAPESTIALATWVWPPRLTVHALAADQELLEPGQGTRILVVLERRG